MILPKPKLIAIAVAAIGVAVALLIHLPLPILLGPIFACLIAALMRIPMASFNKITAAMRTILGVAVGSLHGHSLRSARGAARPPVLVFWRFGA